MEVGICCFKKHLKYPFSAFFKGTGILHERTNENPMQFYFPQRYPER
jgi:hypothetical protein